MLMANIPQSNRRSWQIYRDQAGKDQIQAQRRVQSGNVTLILGKLPKSLDGINNHNCVHGYS